MGNSSSSSILGRTTSNLQEEASQPTESRGIYSAKKNRNSNKSPSKTSTTDQSTRSHTAAAPNDNENQTNINDNNEKGEGEEKNIKTDATDKKPSAATRIVVKDPRGDGPTTCRMTKRESNLPFIESFDPASTYYHRPDIRIHVSLRGDCTSSSSSTSTTTSATTTQKKQQQQQQHQYYSRPLRHDDVVIAPAFFGATHDWTLYHTLLQEMSNLSQQQHCSPPHEEHWVAWHEGAHLIVKNPTGSPTYNQIVSELCTYFQIRKDTIGTRFNWYKDSTDWKPLHHDSA
jgi:hypothetical protein